MERSFSCNISRLEKPLVKTALSWNAGVYRNSDADEPELSFGVNKSGEIKLLALAAVIAATLFAVCLCRKVSGMLRR